MTLGITVPEKDVRGHKRTSGQNALEGLSDYRQRSNRRGANSKELGAPRRADIPGLMWASSEDCDLL